MAARNPPADVESAPLLGDADGAEEARTPPPQPPPPAATVARVHLRARGVCQSVRAHGWGEGKEVLSDVHAAFEPGTMTALMGSSGSGKTTLLNVLRTGSATRGEVLANGLPYTRASRAQIVTVPQDDVLLPGLSALEMFSYAAELRLPASVGAEGRAARVRAVLAQLHLGDESAHTRIGSVEERGLSGGQRKRVSIGLELLTDPPVLLLDEPTSGLDAKMARDVVRILHGLARDGRTVVAAIHQPSARVFCAFDALLLLSKGRLAFAGRGAEAEGYFERLGFQMPAHENPADYYLQLLEDPEEARGVDLMRAWADGSAARADADADADADAGAGAAERAERARAGEGGAGAPPEAPLWRAQVCALFRRRLYAAAKDRSQLGRTLGLKAGVGVLVGVIWRGRGSSESFAAIFPINSALFLIVLNCVLDTLLETVLQFPQQRALLRREHANGLYGASAHYVAMQGANLVVCSLSALLLGAPVYALVGLEPSAAKLGVFVSLLVMMSLIGASIGMAVGVTGSTIDAARDALVPTLVPLIIFSGFLIPLGQIPGPFRWLYYASFFQYCLSALQISHLAERSFSEDCPALLAKRAAAQIVRAAVPGLDIPGAPLPELETCHGEDFLKEVGLWPPPFGGLPGYFAILSAYLLAILLFSYAVVSAHVRQLALSS